MRPVNLAALDQRERAVVRGGLHVLEARDLRQARLPVVRVLAEHVVLRGEAGDLGERTRPNRVRVRERRRISDMRPDVLRDHDYEVQRRRDELRVSGLQLDHDRVVALCADRREVRVGARVAGQVHDLVLHAGLDAVDDVRRGERLAVAPLDALRERKGQGLVAVRPLPAASEPRDGRLAALGADEQALIERALDERAAGEARSRERVEVLREGGIARTRHDEALMRRRPGQRGRCGTDPWGGDRNRHDRECCNDRDASATRRAKPAYGTVHT